MDEAVTTPPTFKRSFSERIYCVEFSPYEWSQHLICIALAKEIVVGTVKFQVCARSPSMRIITTFFSFARNCQHIDEIKIIVAFHLYRILEFSFVMS